MSIKQIDRSSVHRICTGQVVLDLATAVKELIENGIDADATKIDVRLKEYGVDSIEVSDNGCGVEPSNYASLALRHHTSKLSKFSDLDAMETFGFRGEALSALAALGTLVVTTRQADQDVANTLEFGRGGELLKKTPAARGVGTTVIVSNLFQPLPVRHQEFKRNIKKEFSRLHDVLAGYSLVARDVRLAVSNTAKKAGRQNVLRTPGNGSLKDCISSVFGIRQLKNLEQMDAHSDSDHISVNGYVSKLGCGRSSGDRQLFSINSRPVDMPKLARVCNEVWRQFTSHQFPVIVLNITMSRKDCDINVTPDKRQMLLHTETELRELLRSALNKVYAPPALSQTQQLTMAWTGADDTAAAAAAAKTENITNGAQHEDVIAAQSSSSTADERDNPPNQETKKVDNTHTVGGAPSHQVQLPPCVREIPPSNGEAGTRQCEAGKDDVQPGTVVAFPVQPTPSTMLTNPMVSVQSDAPQHAAVLDLLPAPTSGTHNSPKPMTSDTRQSLRKRPAPDSNQSAHASRKRQQAPAPAKAAIKVAHSRPLEPVSTKRRRSNPAAFGNFSFRGADADNLGSQPSDGSFTGKQGTGFSGGDEVKSSRGDPVWSRLRSESTRNVQMADSTSPTASKTRGSAPQRIEQSAIDEPPVRSAGVSGDVLVETSLELIIESLDTSNTSDTSDTGTLGRGTRRFKHANLDQQLRSRGGITTADDKATHELARCLEKDDFDKMQVLGQFNCGFMIAKLGSDLFILDQHACDEKYQFETFQSQASLRSQRMVNSQPMEINVAGELVVLDHLEIMAANGFEFKVDESAPAGRRLRLQTVPMSKNVTFGTEDVYELISLLTARPGVMCRPSRLRSVLASRACRKAVMIGTPLDQPQMQQLVRQMGGLEQPWNCPHGRPTMRHLVDLAAVRADEGAEEEFQGE